MTHPGRRTVVLAGAGLLAAGCTPTRSTAHPGVATTSAGPASAGATSSVTTASPPSTTSPAPTGAALPATVPWSARPSEIDPAVKRAATGVLEAIGAWRAGQAGAAAARRRVAALGQDPALVPSAGPLLSADPAAVVQVVDAQYGGILASSASVLVVLRQWRRRADGVVVATGTTVDVRLVAASPHWQVTALHPATPGHAAAHLSALATAVLAEPRIRLPAAARADVASGSISSSVLAALQGLGRRHVVDVSVVRSGHPLYVFGTNRLSDHPRGRAVDVWALDGRRVVDVVNRSFVEAAMRYAATLGPYQVGGPVDLDGAGLRYFSDNTHHDHIHLGFHA